MSASPVVALALLAYLLLMVGIGIGASRFSSRGVNEFFVGGRRMNRYVVALSAVVSGRSAWLLLGFTGLAYSRGIGAVWAVVGYIAVEALLFLTFARRARAFAGARDCITVPDLFAARFGDSTALRTALGAVILVFMVAYTSAQLVAGGKAFASGLGIGVDAGVALTAAIVLAYTLVGGFLAVSLTDVVQALFMLLSLVVLPLVVLVDLGGPGALVSELSAQDGALIDPLSVGFGAAIGWLGIGLGSPGNPHIVARYLSIDDPDQLRVAAVVGTAWNVLMAAGALLIGLVGRAALPDAASLPDGDAERLFPLLAELYLHPALFGLVLASVFAAIMSTADSQLLVAASTVVRDLYQRGWARDREVPSARLVWLSRATVGALLGLALALSYLATDLVFWLVLFAWAGLGAALGPTSLLALYWKRTTAPGVYAGLLVGTTTTLVWASIPALKGALYELIPAFFLAGLATVGVSLLTRPPPGVDRMFEEMQRRGPGA